MNEAIAVEELVGGVAIGEIAEMRMGPLLPVPQLLRDLGVDPAPLLAATQLDESLFADGERRAPYAKLARLLELGAAASGCADFGLRAGARVGDAPLGALDELVQHCPTVGAALDRIVLYLNWHDRGAVPVLLRLGAARACLGYSINQSHTQGSAQVYGLAMAVAHRILQRLCGSAWAPIEVSFASAAPPDDARYRRFFGAPVRFDADLSAICFAAHWLERPIPGADPARRAATEAALRAALQVQHMPLRDKVQRALHMMIFAGTDNSRALADFCGLHERALRRHLAAEGTSLQQLAHQTRFDLAVRLLRDTRLPAAHIATALHYGDAAAFTRAFRRWAGMTPHEWRVARGSSNAEAVKPPAGP